MGILDGPRLGMKVIDQVVGKPDPRFDPRVKEQERLLDLETEVVPRGTQDVPNILLSDLEGMPFVTSMSDRTAAGGELVRINDTILARPVDLRGGQGFMHENPGLVWASAKSPVSNIMNRAAEMKAQTGIDPIFIPWRMAPTGGDFSTMTGEAMLAFASSAMGKGAKRSLNARIKKKIPDWAGVDDPVSVEQWRNAPDAVRKELKNLMDTQFRGAGGLSIGEARLAVADPKQIDAMEGGIQEVGRIFADEDMVPSDHPSYPFGVPGEGLGRIVDEVGIYELLPGKAAERGIADPLNPSAQDMRAMQMGAQTGVINDTILKRLADRGVNVGGLAAAAVVGGGLLVAPADEANAAALKGLFTPKQSLTDTLSGYSDEALRMLQKSALDEGKADEAARYARELDQRGPVGKPRLDPKAPVAAGMAALAAQSEEAEAAPILKALYRAHTPGRAERIRTGNDSWDDLLFAADKPESAAYYGDVMERLDLTPDAKILREGSKEFARLANGLKPQGMSLLDFSSEMVSRAKGAGYDAVHFSRQSDVGTAIINPDIVTGREIIGESSDWRVGGKYRGRATPGGMAAAGAAAGAAALASEEAEAAPMGTLADGIKMATRQAYHGSPHDFDKFSLAKIGTGEGAQAYGHGLYFSSSEDIAKFYRDSLTGYDARFVKDGVDRNRTEAYRSIVDAISNPGLPEDKAKSIADAVIQGKLDGDDADHMRRFVQKSDWDLPEKEAWLKALDQANEYSIEIDEGKLYTVEIPDESNMLDWDKPLSEQPENVRKALNDIWVERGGSLEGREYPAWTAREGATARDAYAAMSTSLGSEQAASEALRSKGIPGITYKGATSGERNFVVFDDEHINLIQKGLVDPKLLAPMAAGAATIGYATSEFAAAESSLNATESDLQASSERFKALRKGKRAQRLSQELERVLAPVAGPAKALMDATEVMLVGVAGGIPGYLSELTGYVRGQDLEEAKAGGEALAGKLTGTMAEALGEDWDPQNPYLQGLAKAMEQGEKEFQDAYRMLGVENSVMKKGWDQLPERAQRIIKGMADLAL